MRKINFKQPKYIFPAVIFIPLVSLAYFVTEMFAGNDSGPKVATDQISTALPSANANEPKDKLYEMEHRFGGEDAYTAVGAIGEDDRDTETIEHDYSEDELDAIDAAEAERIRQQREMEQLERSLAESRRHINSYRGSDSYESSNDDFLSSYEEIQERAYQRQRALEDRYGMNRQDQEEIAEKRRQDSIARAKEIERERNRPNLVLKSQDANADRFNSVVSDNSGIDAPLIRAMIDQTTKAHEGTRIRFKLLDNVKIQDVTLPKGTYLYGVVTGFGQQRVKANISSVLVGNRFIKIDLSVFDNDGMEGFYVPESAFRDFMKEAAGSAVQQNINFDSSTSGYGGISGEAIALQALQNVYNSATSALSANIRKNRAKIKYNTIVYLINSKEAR